MGEARWHLAPCGRFVALLAAAFEPDGRWN